MPEFSVGAVADATLDDSQPTTPLGALATIDARFTSAKTNIIERCLLRFPLTLLPANATVTSATLRLTFLDAGGAEAGSINYLTDPNALLWTEALVSWNAVGDGVSFWTGGDFDETDRTNFNFSGAFPLPPFDIFLDVAPLVRRSIADGRTNLNIIIKRLTESGVTSGNTYDSREAGQATRPFLTVVYTGAGGLIPLLE